MENKYAYSPPSQWERANEEVDTIKEAAKVLTDRQTEINTRRDQVRKELAALDKEYNEVNIAANALYETGLVNR